jgi:Bacterial dipeptidyl-peptidase Sh3 domain
MPAPRPTGRSSDRRRPTPTRAEEFTLSGPSDLPDPAFNAYRKDLADIRLAGSVIASHYAEVIERKIASRTNLRIAPGDDAEILVGLEPGEPFWMLDDSVGWAWGYAGKDRRVGYVKTDAVGT